MNRRTDRFPCGWRLSRQVVQDLQREILQAHARHAYEDGDGIQVAGPFRVAGKQKSRERPAQGPQ